MKRKLLSLAIPMLILTGVGCESTNKKEDEAMKVSVEQNKKEDYRKNVSYLLEDFSEQSKEIDDLLDSRKSMKKKAVKLKELSKPYFELVDKIEKLDYVSSNDYEVQHNVGKAMIYIKNAVENIQKGLEEEDKDIVEIAKEDLKTGAELIDKATKEMNKNK
ncbi:hypothetical protein COE15_05655 [Bacillus cereus]|uniref:hypothetical protein n=1 Tax=unclassified Bacillus (in: firmicutes) TaxID=185979 RepID=UPI00047CD3F0|nr:MULTISPECIES: hypothetical protein [unclassified Bacillus (in: firmicutes)]PFE05268.1 hypothetical protein CN288_04860 [Bacillus sp. AFS023182]PGY03795.1 hypothetical protein COE15_05655 [Bacillus cereus]